LPNNECFDSKRNNESTNKTTHQVDHSSPVQPGVLPPCSVLTHCVAFERFLRSHLREAAMNTGDNDWGSLEGSMNHWGDWMMTTGGDGLDAAF